MGGPGGALSASVAVGMGLLVGMRLEPVDPYRPGYALATALRVGLVGYVGGLMIQEFRAARDRVHRMAFLDSLTGLPNSRALFSDLGEWMGSAIPNQRITVLFFDADAMKVVNDRHGHRAGDAYLAAMAQTLQAALSPRFTLYRYGGDAVSG